MLNNLKQINGLFKIIAFDWDGTAVTNRKVDASLVSAKIEALLKHDIYNSYYRNKF